MDMQPAPQLLLSHLISELTVKSAPRVYILEGSREENSKLAASIASRLGRKIVVADSRWKELLASIPEAAQGASILFFDEADSLFGKRSEVRDAHDRYAELENAFRGLILLGVWKAETLPPVFLENSKPILTRHVESGS